MVFRYILRISEDKFQRIYLLTLDERATFNPFLKGFDFDFVCIGTYCIELSKEV